MSENSEQIIKPVQEDTPKEDETTKQVVPKSSRAPQLTASTLFFALSEKQGIDVISFKEVSTYVPSAFQMFRVLYEMEKIHTNNRHALHADRSYFPLFSRIYYGILFYVQILRAAKHCSIISSDSLKFLNKFEKLFRYEDLPIAGPLVPFFQNLVCCFLPEPFYAVCPNIPNHTSDAFFPKKFGKSRDVSARCLPNIPVMVALAHTYSKNNLIKLWDTDDFKKNVNINDDAQLDGLETIKGRLVTVPPNGYRFDYDDATISYKTATTAVPFTAHFATHSSSPGMTNPIPYNQEVFKTKQFKKNQLPKLTPCKQNGTTYSLTNYMLMDESCSWFEAIARQAAVESAFWKSSVNMNQITAVGNLSGSIVGISEATGADIGPGAPGSETLQQDPADSSFEFSSPHSFVTKQDIAEAGMLQFIIAGKHGSAYFNDAARFDQLLTGPYFITNTEVGAARTVANGSDPLGPNVITSEDVKYRSQFASLLQVHFYENKPSIVSDKAV